MVNKYNSIDLRSAEKKYLTWCYTFWLRN